MSVVVLCSHSIVTDISQPDYSAIQGRIQEFAMGDADFMASAEREPILGVSGFAPSGVQGQGHEAGGGRPVRL